MDPFCITVATARLNEIGLTETYLIVRLNR